MYGINHSTGDIDSEDDDDGFSDKAALLIMSPPPPPAAAYHPHNNQAADYSNYSSHDLQQQYHMMSYEYPPPPSGQHHHHRPSSSLFDPADQYYSEGGLATITSNYINIPNNNNYINNNNNNNNNDDYDVIKARIASHPSYPKLINAYIDCQKVGAPPEIGVMLEEIRRRKDRVLCKHDTLAALGLDPELDDFMESYYDVLVKYKTDLSRPIDEATSFLANIQTQLANLCKDDDALSSDEELSVVEEEMPDPKARTEDRELKDRLLRRYGNHINSLKVEFSKKKKKGKLPKEARQTLLEWWSVHYKWPYPTEVDKTSLAETTGLDQKQINNWFINQRKRHWKPSENMHLTMMDNLSAHFILED